LRVSFQVFGVRETATYVGQPPGTGIVLAGTSVATETCGHERPLKFNSTVWEY
jgi:hypothetical protein